MEGELVKAPLLTVRDVAKQLQVSASWVYKAVAKNRIPYVNIGALVRFRQADLDIFVSGAWRPEAKVIALPKRGR